MNVTFLHGSVSCIAVFLLFVKKKYNARQWQSSFFPPVISVISLKIYYAKTYACIEIERSQGKIFADFSFEEPSAFQPETVPFWVNNKF